MGGGYSSFIPADEIRAAVDLIGDVEEGIAEEEREKLLEKIERKIADRRMKANKLSPSRFFVTVEGKVVADVREMLVRTWFNVQKEINAPCNCYGLALELCSKAEQNAWNRLDMRANPYGAYCPAQKLIAPTETH